MKWQDFILTGGIIMFIIALIPSVISKNKPAKATCIITASTNLIFAFVYITLGLWLTFSFNLITTTLWAIMIFQSRKEKKKK